MLDIISSILLVVLENDLDWVIENTVFLHFCGKDKPWRKDYKGRYAALYKHYQHRVKILEK